MTELFYVLFLIIGFFLGWKYREFVAIKTIHNLVEHSEKINAIQVKIERVDGQLFVYNKDTSEYMAHASDRYTLEKMLKEKFPGKTFGTTSDDIKKLDESI